MERERLWRKRFVKQMSFYAGVKAEGVIGDESEDGDCDEAMNA